MTAQHYPTPPTIGEAEWCDTCDDSTTIEDDHIEDNTPHTPYIEYRVLDLACGHSITGIHRGPGYPERQEP